MSTVYVYPPRTTVYVPAPQPTTVYVPAPRPTTVYVSAPPPAVVSQAPYTTYVVRERRCDSAVLPSAAAGAIIGGAIGPHGHRWTYAGRGALIGAGAGILLDILSR